MSARYKVKMEPFMKNSPQPMAWIMDHSPDGDPAIVAAVGDKALAEKLCEWLNTIECSFAMEGVGSFYSTFRSRDRLISHCTLQCTTVPVFSYGVNY